MVLLDALPPSMVLELDGSIGEVPTREVAYSPLSFSDGEGLSSVLSSSASSIDSDQSSGEESQHAVMPSRVQQLRHQTSVDQMQAKPYRTVLPATSTSSPFTAKKASGKKQLNYNPNRAREERREEIIYLRHKVKEMEEQLAVLKAGQPHGGAALRLGQKRPLLASPPEPTHGGLAIVRSASTGSVTGSGSPDLTQNVRPRMWEDICALQLEQRDKAERENVRLKHVLEGQIKIAKSMDKLLFKRETFRVSVSLAVWSDSL